MPRIYLIQDKLSGLIKIGIAGAPVKRMQQLQEGCPGKMILLGHQKGNAETELNLHKRFASHHVRGEWFSASDEILAYAGRLGGRFEPPDKPKTFVLNSHFSTITKRGRKKRENKPAPTLFARAYRYTVTKDPDPVKAKAGYVAIIEETRGVIHSSSKRSVAQAQAVVDKLNAGTLSPAQGRRTDLTG